MSGVVPGYYVITDGYVIVCVFNDRVYLICTVFSEQNPFHYTSSARSVRICGHVTSIRLENKFWQILESLAISQNKTLGQFISKLYMEALDNNIDMKNFSSLLRCSCLIHLENRVDQVNAA
ncbi:ribbon-helix-helix domain-containing protein [Edwardsiella tarda]|uniref:ribbon-helix-helix domain-containing protein n=1 Tax=Edwardsiella tarda TaxID=636 RepID=UPI00351C4DB9